MIGHKLSHYEIKDEISRGGMGVVYRAVDVKLNRDVAIKVLAPDLVSDPNRKSRFVREAQATAALKHANIAVIYELDDADETTFIAMELIEGEKLSDVLARERLPLSSALELACEVLDGIAKAHERGIAHRDLTPANIMVADDGHPKIIDFGLAKLLERPGGDSEGTEALTRDETKAGTVLGTYAYMSPEASAAGEPVELTPILSDRVATWDDAEQLTFDQAFVEFVDISPDGKRIVLSSDRSGNPDLWIMPTDGGEMTQLTTDPTPDWFPSWSPDGSEIAFYAYRSGNRHIWVMPAGGGVARQVTLGESEDYHPVWSPDGERIAFFQWTSRRARERSARDRR